MHETLHLLREWHSLERAGEEILLATLVHTDGSSYRRAGARMLMTAERWHAGGISGGCVEQDILRKALWRTADEGVARVEYDSTSEEDDTRWGFRLGCQGRLELLLERLRSEDPVHPLAFIERCFTEQRPGAMATIVRGDGLGRRVLVSPGGRVATSIQEPALRSQIAERAASALADERSHAVTIAGTDVSIEIVMPPRPLILFGSNYDVLPLLEQAKCIGWDVTLAVGRETPALRPRFAAADRIVLWPASDLAISGRSALVVMTHNYEADREILKRVLPSPAAYVGVLGPRRRTERLLADVAQAGVRVDADQITRVHSPVGLDLGCDGPAEIALSVVAEIQQVLSHRTGRPLSDVKGLRAVP